MSGNPTIVMRVDVPSMLLGDRAVIVAREVILGRRTDAVLLDCQYSHAAGADKRPSRWPRPELTKEQERLVGGIEALLELEALDQCPAAVVAELCKVIRAVTS